MFTPEEGDDYMGSLKDLATSRSDIFAVHPSKLSVKPGWNSRSLEDPANQSHIESLALSIAEIGVREPLTVYWENDEIWISDGHCRHAAALIAIARGADIKTVPVKTEARYSSEADRVFSQIVRNSGKPLTPYEQGKVFKRLMDYGWTEVEIAKKGGFSINHVKGNLELQAAPQTIQEAVKSGEISATLATKLVRKMGGEAAASSVTEALREVKAKGRTRATESDVLQKPKKTRHAHRKVKSDSSNVSAIARARASGFWLNAADTEIVRSIIIDAYVGVQAVVVGAENTMEMYTFQMSEMDYERIKDVLKV